MFEAIFRALPWPAVVFDAGGRVRAVNGHAEALDAIAAAGDDRQALAGLVTRLGWRWPDGREITAAECLEPVLPGEMRRYRVNSRGAGDRRRDITVHVSGVDHEGDRYLVLSWESIPEGAGSPAPDTRRLFQHASVANVRAEAETPREQRGTDAQLREAMHRLQLATASAKAGVWDWQLSTNQMFWDDHMLEMYGTAREGFRGGVEAWVDALHPDDRARALEACEAALRGDREYDTQFRIQRPDGGVVHVKANGLVLRDEHGVAVRMIGLNIDVTETVLAQSAARQHAQEVTEFFDLAIDLLCIADTSGMLRRVSPRWTAVLDWKPEELTGRSFVDLVHPEDVASTRQAMATLSQRQPVRGFVNRYRCRDGSYRWLEWHSTSTDGFTVFAVARDITDRRVKEEALRHSEQRFKALLEAASEPIFVQTERRFAYLNEAAVRIFGAASAEELIGTLVEERFDPSARTGIAERIRRLNEEGLPTSAADVTGFRPDGTRFVIETSASPVVYDGKRGAVVFARDVTARRALEAQLAAGEEAAETQKQLLHSIIDGTPSLIWALDRDGRILFANQAASAFLNRTKEELVGVYPPDELEADVGRDTAGRHARVVDSGRTEIGETSVTIGGTPRTVMVSRHPLRDGSGRIYGAASITTDITERKRIEAELREREAEARRAQSELEVALAVTRRTEEQLRQAQKMEAVGQLAGGVAHDFNNLLTVILAESEELCVRLPDGDPLRELAEEIADAGQRAAGLTRQLLAFSRRQVLEPKVVSVNQLIAHAEKMLRRVIGEDIELALLLSTKVGLCRLDVGQFEQVLMNLVVNSRDAMPEGGRITIETASVDLDERYAASHPEIAAGPHALVSVSDTGVGMTLEAQARLFEPFFTTKPRGQGTGLGLSTVYGIVKQSGGTIWVYSEPGQGTTFRIHFPEVAADRPDELPERPHTPQRGSETILLVEDDDHVRHSVSGVLQRAGYHVIESLNGGDALLTCEQHGAKIHLLLTDVVMPKVNGRKLAERLQQVRPDLRVIFMSGYTEDAIVHHGVLDSGIDFVPKPIRGDALLAKVREVLDRDPDRRG